MARFSTLDLSILRLHWRGLSAVFVLTGVVNVLMLSGAIYMLQVYDRVLMSRSGATLLFLSLIMVVLYIALYFFDIGRQRILGLIGRDLEERLSEPLFTLAIRLPLHNPDSDRYSWVMRDLEEVGRFMSGAGLTAVYDLPWMPLYVLVCFLFHPLIGAVTVLAILVVIALTVLGEWLAQRPTSSVASMARARQSAADEAQRRAEVIAAMGFSNNMLGRFQRVSRDYHDVSGRLNSILITFGGLTRTFRIFVQSALLGVAAWLVINEQATPGVMIASSIIAARALSPIDQLVGRWRSIAQVRESWKRINNVLEMLPPEQSPLHLPEPGRTMSVEDLWVAPAGSREATVTGVSFQLEAGDALGIIGPSGSGKSTLVRGLAGVWAPLNGHVRLDGALLEQFALAQRADAIGYLPQDTQLIRGTVAENICRFDTTALPPAIIEAARLVGAHEMILALPAGYATDVGIDGLMLSGGQRQRIGLARAVYGAPFVVLLDEPNSNLDSAGEAALAKTIRGIRDRGGICIIVAHRIRMLDDVNKLLLIVDGKVKAFGDRDHVLSIVAGTPGKSTAPKIAGAPQGQPRNPQIGPGGGVARG